MNGMDGIVECSAVSLRRCHSDKKEIVAEVSPEAVTHREPFPWALMDYCHMSRVSRRRVGMNRVVECIRIRKHTRAAEPARRYSPP